MVNMMNAGHSSMAESGIYTYRDEMITDVWILDQQRGSQM